MASRTGAFCRSQLVHILVIKKNPKNAGLASPSDHPIPHMILWDPPPWFPSRLPINPTHSYDPFLPPVFSLQGQE